MFVAVAIGIVVPLITLVIGGFLAFRPAVSGGRLAMAHTRFDDVRLGLQDQIGQWPAAALTWFAGVGLVGSVFWLLGVGAHALQGPVDVPVFHFFEHRQVGGFWQHANNLLTQMGNSTPTQVLAVIGAIVFAVAWRRHRYVPPILFLFGYLTEKYSQAALKTLVHRGHPPTTLGTWPSGGCGRLLLIYGLYAFCLIVAVPGMTRRLRILAWTVVAFLAAIEAYTRTYLLKHWVTDVVGGLAYGVVLLLVMMAVGRVLIGREPAHRADVALPRQTRNSEKVAG
ncbi:MAG: phosphatase PAP2 family protein [Nocardioidaceae bacterium]